MGKYIPSPWSKRRSIEDALVEAEELHYLECPNADSGTRLAALVLDSIFIFIVVSAINRLSGLALNVLQPPDAELSPATVALAQAIRISLIAFVWYASQIWSTVRYGGSPAKLILGLRIIDVETGGNIGFAQVWLREALKIASFAGTAGLVAVVPLKRSDRRALHDLLSGAALKKVRPS